MSASAPETPSSAPSGDSRLRPIAILGPDPFAQRDPENPAARIATVFPRQRTLVTLPGIHATQRLDFLAREHDRRRAAGLPALPADEQEQLLQEAVDLILDGDLILIRPDPSRMDLSFAADELLGDLPAISRRQIRFLFVRDPQVRDAVQARGENWRISPLPQSVTEMTHLIETSRVAIREGAIYYYNRFTGTRLLTCGQFAALAALPDDALARQLDEIAHFSREHNVRGHAEVAFFAAPGAKFGPADFAGPAFAQLAPAPLRERFHDLRERFARAVDPEDREDHPREETWRHRMLQALVAQHYQTSTAELVSGLGSEFFLQIEWLPGGHSEEGEFIIDPLYEEMDRRPDDSELRRLCDPLVQGFMFSYLREYGNVEYINIGRIGQSLSRDRPQAHGRRGVYVVQLKLQGVPQPVLRHIRMQKWGLRERLDEGRSLLQALLENEEYTDYVLDRRLGLRQLGMNLPPRIRVLHTREVYHGLNREVDGQTVPVICFERDYLAGQATDKLPASRYLIFGYAQRLASLLGRAAASNLIVGRAAEQGLQVIFDDGDEVVLEDPLTRLPSDLVVSDPSGSFADYQRSLFAAAPAYARPVNARAGMVPSLHEFAAAYLIAFQERFTRLQAEYRRRRRAFDHLFKHCRHDRAGSFAYRWECVLQRLDATDPPAITNAIRAHIEVLQAPPPP